MGIGIVLIEIYFCFVISAGQVFQGLCGFECWTTSHHFVMFCVYWSSGDGDISYSIGHVTSQDNEIEALCDFMG